ncbi:thiamine phosphate synthase [Jeotgalibacillus soli]|uniref:Thiamine-phosphate synthase n=1 Tax=Jeotgalibacillus soli TaxID=889306 RepID=A0A0C2W7T0_9BACL|nr:thiamine phosphate synthase [Jeotgalibacillus soli]KIL52073.1 thiamine-phosphate pyrophosphorylase [Jeotgalibacillus soli]
MTKIKDQLGLYFIMGSQNCLHDPIWTLEEAIQGGITCFQFREKGTGSFQGQEKLELAKALQSLCQKNKLPFIVNDDLDLADQLGVDGVHVGQDDEHISIVRKAFPKAILGLSVSRADEGLAVSETEVDYLGIGPIYSTSTKEDAKHAIGPEAVRLLQQAVPAIPRVAIGGINQEHVTELMQSGADGVAVISAISQANDPRSAARAFVSKLF